MHHNTRIVRAGRTAFGFRCTACGDWQKPGRPLYAQLEERPDGSLWTAADLCAACGVRLEREAEAARASSDPGWVPRPHG